MMMRGNLFKMDEDYFSEEEDEFDDNEVDDYTFLDDEDD